jgi:hypothetical protein
MAASATDPENPTAALSFDRSWDGKTDSTPKFKKDVRDKQKPQRIDSSRLVNFHLPRLVKGSYNRNGEKGNGRVLYLRQPGKIGTPTARCSDRPSSRRSPMWRSTRQWTNTGGSRCC